MSKEIFSEFWLKNRTIRLFLHIYRVKILEFGEMLLKIFEL